MEPALIYALCNMALVYVEENVKKKEKQKQCLFGSYAMIIKGAIKWLASNMEGNILEMKKTPKTFFFFLPLQLALCVVSPPNVNETSQYSH